MTAVSLNYMLEYAPCGVFQQFLAYKGKVYADDTLVDIVDFVSALEPLDALWPLETLPAFKREKALFQQMCAKAVLPHVLRDNPEPKALLAQVDSFSDFELSDADRSSLRQAALAEQALLGSILSRAAARVACLQDVIKAAESAAWVSRRGGCGSASLDRQKEFLLSLSV